MPQLPRLIGFLVQRAEMLVRSDLQGVLRADRLIAGAALVDLYFPVALEVTSATAGAEFLRAAKSADDHAGFKFETHQDFVTRRSSRSSISSTVPSRDVGPVGP